MKYAVEQSINMNSLKAKTFISLIAEFIYVLVTHPPSSSAFPQNVSASKSCSDQPPVPHPIISPHGQSSWGLDIPRSISSQRRN